MRLPHILLIAILSLTACQNGQMPQAWNDLEWQMPEWGKASSGETETMPMKKNSDFDDRLAGITERLGTPADGANGIAPAPVGKVDEEKLSRPTVKVALVVPLSGPQKALGESMIVAGQMAMQDMGEQNIELLPRDSGATPAEASRAVTEAVGEGAKLILGPVFADQVKIAQTDSVPLIGFTTDASAAGPDTYVMGFLPYEQVRRVMQFAAERKARDVVVIAPDSPYGRAVARTAQEFKGLPVKPIVAGTAESVDSMIAKMRPHLSPQTAILIAYDGISTRRLVAGLKKVNVTPQNTLLMGTGLLDDPTLSSARELEGVFFASAPTAQRERFENRYRSVAKKAPVRLASLAYDATALAVIVARSTNDPSNPFPKDQITDPSGFAGIDGVFRFGKDGLVTRNLSVLTWTAGQLREVAPAAKSF